MNFLLFITKHGKDKISNIFIYIHTTMIDWYSKYTTNMLTSMANQLESIWGQDLNDVTQMGAVNQQQVKKLFLQYTQIIEENHNEYHNILHQQVETLFKKIKVHETNKQQLYQQQQDKINDILEQLNHIIQRQVLK